MKRILITGATGNIGSEVIRFLYKIETKNKIVAAVRNIEKAQKKIKYYPQLDFVQFDFENPEKFERAFKNIDCVFLLRPPQIADVDQYFKPLIVKMKDEGINQIVFLSVQGVEKSPIIPHHKIEKLIQESGLNYIFLRPSYFMQNLTTILLSDIQNKRKIILPAGKAKFNWIDVENIGEASAILLNDFEQYKNQAVEITGYENKNFSEVTVLINQTIEDKIEFVSSNPLRFYNIKKDDGLETGMILVMIMLHFLPRFQKEPIISDLYEKLTGEKPTSLEEFIERENKKFTSFHNQ
ncbi:NmrA family NAD(P)-binding protein [Calothrix sp. CCY 0018]|uniref:NmrA family NAD(P)-binding protein n=1 Tax=Calothrix sp. CCY 0018 TaxID=3103864 RepID=UPI0039C5ED0D